MADGGLARFEGHRFVSRDNGPVRCLFEAPTLEELAAVVIQQQVRQLSESEMQRLLAEVDAMPGEDAEQSYKD